jgi:hypothetical protein
MNLFTAAGLGAVLLGAAGFAAGFFGPMLLNPSANQGPLVGLLITGPGGAVLGAALGLLLGALGVPRATLLKILYGTAAVGATVILFFALPGPKFRGNVVEVEVTRCSSPAALRDEAFAYWDKRIAAAHWAPARPGWKEGFDNLVAGDPGVVLNVRVKRAAGLYENRKPWNRGTFSAGKTAWVQERYFLRGATCADQAGRTAVYAARGEDAKGWPPEKLSNFLDLQVLQPATAQQTGFLP